MTDNVNKGELGFDEVVDTLADALEVTEDVHRAVADGVQITDLGTLFSIAPKLNEIRKDAATFKAQVADLKPAESQEVERQLALRTGQSQDGIVQRALEAFDLMADWHVQINTTVRLVERTIDFGKSLVGKKAAA